jgi:hypothetical protein
MGKGVDIGGGLVCAVTNARIENCDFSYNKSTGLNGAGGAIYVLGGYLDHIVKNCLFTNNAAEREGGAIGCGAFASPIIANSTFASNNVSRLGGASSATGVPTTIGVPSSEERKPPRKNIRRIRQFLCHQSVLRQSGRRLRVNETRRSYFLGADLGVTNMSAIHDGAGPLGQFCLMRRRRAEKTSPAVDAGSDFVVTPVERAHAARRCSRCGVIDLSYRPDHGFAQIT